MTDKGLPSGNWNYPTAIRFGAGRIQELPDVCRELGITRPLLVTDPGLANMPMVRNAIANNAAAGLPTGQFHEIQPNPVGKNVDDGVAVMREGGHDGVIAWGGGSGMDAAKAIALLVGQNRPLWDFEDRADWWTRADASAIPPIIAVPTTAGTGSEVGRASVITDEGDHTKKIIFHPKMLPSVVISDPELTVGLPANITAWTGMDALAHNLEAYSAPGFHPMADGIAMEGMRLVKDFLPRAVAAGSDLVARGNMLVAATMGATSFQKGLGAIHSLSHPIGALLHTHHGRTNAVVMPYVMAFNRDAVAQQYTALARYLGLPQPSFDAVMTWVLELRDELSIDHTLRDLGVDDSQTDELIRQAANDPTAGTNPVPLNQDNLARVFRNAMDGSLG